MHSIFYAGVIVYVGDLYGMTRLDTATAHTVTWGINRVLQVVVQSE